MKSSADADFLTTITFDVTNFISYNKLAGGVFCGLLARYSDGVEQVNTHIVCFCIFTSCVISSLFVKLIDGLLRRDQAALVGNSVAYFVMSVLSVVSLI